MARETVICKAKLTNRYGLHARPAVLFVELCNRFLSDVIVQKDDLRVNGKAILDIMTLGAEPGSELTIEITGEDAKTAAAEILALIQNNFGEEPA